MVEVKLKFLLIFLTIAHYSNGLRCINPKAEAFFTKFGEYNSGEFENRNLQKNGENFIFSESRKNSIQVVLFVTKKYWS